MTDRTSIPSVIGLFAKIALAYFVASSLLNYALRDDALFAGTKFLNGSWNAANLASHALPGLVALVVFAYVRAGSPRLFAERFLRAFQTLVYCCVFLAGFSSIKTLLPFLVETLGQPHFFADPFFAELDKALHFGVDPWRATHALTHGLGLDGFAGQASVIYGLWWMILAFYLPAIMVLVGENGRTLRHYLILYVFCWIVLGNIVAMIGSSAGPIYYDRVFATARFDELHTSLLLGGMEGTWLGRVQPLLWQAYSEDAQTVGSGLAAFPSLHVALATVIALYCNEKSRWTAIFGWVFLATIQFISVWCGYHYAIDGYFSIVAVVAAHVVLKRGALRRRIEEPSPA